MLKRTTPMKRSGFASQWQPRPPVEERPERPIIRMVRVPEASAPVFAPQPKRDYIRSESLLAAVRKVPYCMLCARSFVGGEHADPAHSNWSGHGKAGSIKADDNRIAALCRIPCHTWVDASGDDWNERFDAWWQAHGRTVDYLTRRNLWPRGVPIPDTDEFPKELT